MCLYSCHNHTGVALGIELPGLMSDWVSEEQWLTPGQAMAYERKKTPHMTCNKGAALPLSICCSLYSYREACFLSKCW